MPIGRAAVKALFASSREDPGEVGEPVRRAPQPDPQSGRLGCRNGPRCSAPRPDRRVLRWTSRPCTRRSGNWRWRTIFRTRAYQGGHAGRKAMIDRTHPLPLTRQAGSSASVALGAADTYVARGRRYFLCIVQQANETMQFRVTFDDIPCAAVAPSTTNTSRFVLG